MDNKMKKCIKFEICLNIDDNNLRNNIYKELHKIQYKTRLVCNKAMNLQYNELVRQMDGVDKRTENEIYGCSLRNHTYRYMCKELDGIYSGNIAQTSEFSIGKNVFKKQELKYGEESLSTFKNDMPIMIANKSYSFKDNIQEFIVDIKLFNRAKAKEFGSTTFPFKIINPNGSQKATIIKMINKEYKQGSAQISYNKRKKKFILTCSFSFASDNTIALDENKTLGIDLGIVNTATFSIYDTDKGYEYIKGDKYISGEELIHFRQTLEQRRNNLYKATKWASDAKIGHGYNKRCEDANKISDKVSRFKDAYNHKVSRYIVDVAVKNKCSTIQMEDLSGFSQAQEDSMLKNWSYFDLQKKIKYKAKEKGIFVNFINPMYTSKRCSKCGHIDDENRDCKKNQSKFKCVACGFECNADDNASRNIAIPNIDLIIQEKAKELGLYYKDKNAKKVKVS